MLQYHTALFFGSPSFLSDFSPSVDKAGTNVLRVRSIQAAAESRQSPRRTLAVCFLTLRNVWISFLVQLLLQSWHGMHPDNIP